MNTGLILLRKLNPDLSDPLMAQLSSEHGVTFFPIEQKGVGTEYYVNDDRPRNSEFTSEIMLNTLGWTLFDSDMNKLVEYSRLDKALAAKESARVVIKTDVDFDEDPEPKSRRGSAAA